MPATHHTWNRWWIVFAAMLGLIVGKGSINLFAKYFKATPELR